MGAGSSCVPDCCTVLRSLVKSDIQKVICINDGPASLIYGNVIGTLRKREGTEKNDCEMRNLEVRSSEGAGKYDREQISSCIQITGFPYLVDYIQDFFK